MYQMPSKYFKNVIEFILKKKKKFVFLDVSHSNPATYSCVIIYGLLHRWASAESNVG